MFQKILIWLCCFYILCFANPKPYSPISPNFVQDFLKGGNKSGFIVGGGVGIPSTPTQFLTTQTFKNSSAYGFHVLIGYQNFASKLTPFPPNYFGARLLFEIYNTYHITKSGSINSNALLFSYDLLYDFFPRNKQTFGLILGFNMGAIRIQNYQNFSYGIGIKAGFGFSFDENHRLETTYILARSGALKGNRFYLYSPYTINITYTYRFDIPFHKLFKKK